MNNNYDLATWLSDVSNILAQREFIRKEDAEDEIYIHIDMLKEQFKLGYSPMQAYLEYIE